MLSQVSFHQLPALSLTVPLRRASIRRTVTHNGFGIRRMSVRVAICLAFALGTIFYVRDGLAQPNHCKVEQKTCSSEGEFRELLKPYMGSE